MFYQYFKNGLLIAILAFMMSSCDEESYIPKQRGYYKIDFPVRQYVTFNEATYPYTFEYPAYASIVKDTMFFDQKTENPWWINIEFPTLGGKVYLSYKTINANNQLDKLLEDSYQMSHFHTKKADYINEPEFHTANNVHGLYYDVGGNAASAFQFYATDSVKHFLRGALYFDATPNADSLKPVNEFLIEDIRHIVNSIKWTR
jgi:gliding motility-associated lipoprotein GldD